MRLTDIVIGFTEIELSLMVILAKLKYSDSFSHMSENDKAEIRYLGQQYELLTTMWCYHLSQPQAYSTVVNQILRCVNMNVSVLPCRHKCEFMNGQYIASTTK